MGVERGRFDSELQMFVTPEGEPNMGRLRFMRWRAEHNHFDSPPLSPPKGSFVLLLSDTEISRAVTHGSLFLPLKEVALNGSGKTTT